jgi:hypothetical protein
VPSLTESGTAALVFNSHVLSEKWVLETISLFGWLVADGWCWFVLIEEYCWLVAGGWFDVREKYCWLVADNWMCRLQKHCATTAIHVCVQNFLAGRRETQEDRHRRRRFDFRKKKTRKKKTSL